MDKSSEEVIFPEYFVIDLFVPCVDCYEHKSKDHVVEGELVLSQIVLFVDIEPNYDGRSKQLEAAVNERFDKARLVMVHVSICAVRFEC